MIGGLFVKKRTISAAIITLIALPLLLIGGIPYAIAVGILSLVAFKEIINLKEPREKKLPIIMMAIYLVAFLIVVYSNYDGKGILFGLSYDRIGLVLISTLLPSMFYIEEEYFMNRALRILGLITLVGLGFNMMISIFNLNKALFLYLVFISMSTDIYAYISGMLIGKHKLSSKISPNKSWEGSIIGTLMGTFIAVMFYINFIGTSTNIVRLILITMLLSVIGQLGDLFFSAIKREYKIKDYSNLIPGHGGILDRFDSIIFVLISYLIFRFYI